MANKVFSETVIDPIPTNSSGGNANRIAPGESLHIHQSPTGGVRIVYNFLAPSGRLVEQTIDVPQGGQGEVRLLSLLTTVRAAVWLP